MDALAWHWCEILQSGDGGTDMSMMGRFVQVSPDRLKQILDDPSGVEELLSRRKSPRPCRNSSARAGLSGPRADDRCVDGGDGPPE